MRNRLFTLAGALTLLAVLGKFYVPPLLAQARAALVKSVDEPGRVPYQASQSSFSNCGVYGLANFPTVPAGKRLVITFVSGIFDFSANSFVLAQLYTSPSAVDCGALLSGPNIVQPFSLQGNEAQYSTSIQFYVDEGNTPVIRAGASSAFLSTMNFTIVGYLVDKTM